jgi:hypothetical protein
VRRVDLLIGGDAWAELIARARRPVAPTVVRVSPAQLKALYAPAPDEVASWPALPDGGVVTEIGKRT